MAGRTLIRRSTLLSKSFSSPSLVAISSSSPPLRFLSTLCNLHRGASSALSTRCFSSRPTTSSLNDQSPNWNNRPPKETILLEGCDFEHWLIVVEKPEGDPTRDEIIDSYIKIGASILGSEEEARKQIYSVSTRHYFAFGIIVPEEVSYKFKELPNVRWVLPDSYLDVRNKDYGGEPFINGQAVPYDPKYHEEWVRNNARANERSRRNDRPRNFDRSRNFERRRENMQNRDFQGPPGGSGGPGPNPMGGGAPGPNVQHGGPNMGGGAPGPNVQHMGPNMGGGAPGPNVQNNSPHYGNMSPNPSMQRAPPNYAGPPPAALNYGGVTPGAPNNGYPGNNSPNYPGLPPRDVGPNAGYPSNIPTRDAGPAPGYPSNIPNAGNASYNNPPNSMPYQSRDGPGPMPNRDYQNSYVPNRNSGSANAYQVRDAPVGGPEYPNNDY